MITVLDTSVLIDLQRDNKKTKQALREISKKYPYPAKITVFNKFEFLTGLLSNQIANEQKAMEFLSNFSVLQTTEKSAQIFAELKSKYDKKGSQVPLVDLLIAGLVIENGLTLITKDTDFERIDELRKIVLQ